MVGDEMSKYWRFVNRGLNRFEMASRSSSESVNQEVSYLKEPDTYTVVGKWWDDAIDHANEVLGYIREWNELMGPTSNNHYWRTGIQAYAIIKTLPSCEPWANFRRTYWSLLRMYVATGAIQGYGVTMKNIDKSLIRWEGTVEEVRREMDITMERQRQGQIYPNDPHWREMYDRIIHREEERMAGMYGGGSSSSSGTRSHSNSRTPTVQGSSTTDSTQSGTTYGEDEGCKICGPDYVPETPPISSDDSGYYYDPYKLD